MTLIVGQIATGASTTLVNGDNTPLCAQISANGGSGYIARQTWDIQFTGGGGPTAVSLYRDAWNGTLISGGPSQVVTLAPFAGKWVAAFTTEDAVDSGAPMVYCLRVVATGVVPASRLTATLMEDISPPASLMGSTGYVYNPLGDSLYLSANGLCGAGDPNFVWTGATSHTAPAPACDITSYGTPDYADGSLIGSWTVTNTMAP